MNTPIKALQKKDIAEALGCSVRQIEIMVRNGTVLKPTNIGGMVRWHPDMFREWFDSCFLNRDFEEAAQTDDQEIEATQVVKRVSRAAASQSSAVKRMYARQANQLNFA